MNNDRGQRKSTDRQRWLTDSPLPEDTSTPKRWFLLDDEQVWIHKQWSQLYALLTRNGGKTSEAVSGSMAIKHTQGLCFLLLLAYHSNIGFYSMSDQTFEIFLKYYHNRRDTFETEQRDNSDEFIALEVLSAALLKPTRQMPLSKLDWTNNGLYCHWRWASEEVVWFWGVQLNPRNWVLEAEYEYAALWLGCLKIYNLKEQYVTFRVWI